jgi:hypothetical protein
LACSRHDCGQIWPQISNSLIFIVATFTLILGVCLHFQFFFIKISTFVI